MRNQTMVLCLMAMLALPFLVFGEEVTVVAAFPGNKGPGWKTSIDAAGAVGPRHVVAFDVVGFVARDKSSGKVRQRLSASDFWRHVQPAGTLDPKENPNDSRILYDPLSERWFACAAGTSEPDCFLAVSTSADPTLFVYVHRPLSSRYAVDLPSVLHQRHRQTMVYGLGGIPIQRESVDPRT